MEVVAIFISSAALIISLLTFWLTKLRKGKIRITRPTLIFFGPDGVGSEHNKVFIRTLIYCTAENGRYIQNIFIRLHRAEIVQNFSVWVYDDNGLKRGSGLYINRSGVSANHHFLMTRDGSKYEFLAGEYLLQIYIEPIGRRPKRVFEQKLLITKSQATELNAKNSGIYFDWIPNTQSYSSFIDDGPKNEKLDAVLTKLLSKKKQE